MDNIFLFVKNPQDLETNTKKVLQRLQENDLFLKPPKCEFSKTKVEWLGMIIEEGRISMDPGKLKGISEWPSPTTVKQTRGFLGFGNFYWRFIQHFSEIAKPLNDLLKKDQKFDWTSICQKAFDKLKKRFTEELVLMMLDHTRPFQIECDDEQGEKTPHEKRELKRHDQYSPMTSATIFRQRPYIWMTYQAVNCRQKLPKDPGIVWHLVKRAILGLRNTS